MIQDSGTRQEFETGAVRDIQKGKGRCDLMPLDVVCNFFYHRKMSECTIVFARLYKYQQTKDKKHLYDILENVSNGYMFGDISTMLLEVSVHFEEGAEKYGENNWQKGLPVNCYINSAIRHFLKWLRGDEDERHDRAFVWNILCCIWTIENIDNKEGEQ